MTFVALEACVWEFLHELLYPQATDAEEVTIEEKYIIKKHRMQAGGKKSED